MIVKKQSLEQKIKSNVDVAIKDFKSNQNNTKGSMQSTQDAGSTQDTKSPNIVRKPSTLDKVNPKSTLPSGSSPKAPMRTN